MKMTVSETAKLTGISVRTLHYYDEIGLLKPSLTTESGYRFYDEEALAVLQQILLYRELDFSLKEIRDILSMPDYQREEALKAHRKLLVLKRKRLGKLIGLVDEMMRGENTMSFQEFDSREIEAAKKKYAREVRERWGKTAAYEESQKRTDRYDEEKWKALAAEMEEIFSSFASCMRGGADPGEERVQALVRSWKAFITENYYECTDEILSGLGKMYVEDGRFTANIDRAGAGTAAFISRAIQKYCG